jgi:linoleoyl-CoA desaturase
VVTGVNEQRRTDEDRAPHLPEADTGADGDAPSAPPDAAWTSLARLIQPTPDELRRGQRRLHGKAAAIAAIVVVSYAGLVFAPIGILGQLVCALGLVVGVVGVGTGIMHDANHGAFSRSTRLNHAVGYSSDLVGASSWVWRYKHNKLHHANTNVVGVDSDIDQSPFARLAPDQPWRPWHRYQHIYLWFLYGWLSMKFLVADFVALARGGFGDQAFTHPPRRRDLALIVAGKAFHVTWALLIPLAFHPWWAVLAFYVGCSWLAGFTLAMIFQLAHCNELAEFFEADGAGRGREFEARQLRSTADIRCQTPVLGAVVRWIMGGLDHQVVHHLSPRVPHGLYPQMAAKLAPLCADRGLPYHVNPTLTSAVRAHSRWLKAMGQPPATQI